MINGRFMTVSAIRSEIAARQRADRMWRENQIEQVSYRRVERGAVRSGDDRDLTSGDVQRRRTIVGLRAWGVQNDRRVRRRERRMRRSEWRNVRRGIVDSERALRDSEMVRTSVTGAGDSMRTVATGAGVIRDVAVQATDVSPIDRSIGMGETTEDLDDMIRSGIDGEMSNEQVAADINDDGNEHMDVENSNEQMAADEDGERMLREVIARSASHEERTEIEETILALRAGGNDMQEIFDLIRPA